MNTDPKRQQRSVASPPPESMLGRGSRLCLVLLAAFELLALAGCSEGANEIDDLDVDTLEARLEGDWEWQPGVSELAIAEIDGVLRATQTSTLDADDAAPSEYTVAVIEPTVLQLDGWLAASYNDPCDPDDECDRGRRRRVVTMSFFVDEEVFLPFAFLPEPDSDVGRTYRAWAEEVAPGERGALVLQHRDDWVLALDDAGRYVLTQTRTHFVDESGAPLATPREEILAEETGGWHEGPTGDDIELASAHAEGSLVYLRREGLLSFDGLVFRRVGD